MRVGLVLEGGAMRGMFTAGVLDIFMHEGIKIDGIVAVSAGALFGVNFPSNQPGRVLRYNKQYLSDPRYIGLRSLLATGNVVNKQFAFYDVPFRLDPFDQQAFERSGIDFHVVITNVTTGKPEYVKIHNVFEQMEVLRASSAMPFVSKIVELNGQYYLDGGLSDSIPLNYCRQLGYDKIIVILTRPFDYRKTPSNPLLFKLFYSRYPNLVRCLEERYAMYNAQVEEVIRADSTNEIFALRPSQTLPIKRLENNWDKIQQVYNLGVHDAKNRLVALQAYLTK